MASAAATFNSSVAAVPITVPEPCATSTAASAIQLHSSTTATERRNQYPPSLRPSLSWSSIRSTLSVSEKTSAQLGWAVAFLSVLFTVVTLSPAFKSQTATEKALKIAEWTALKDYIEECREEVAAGIESQACLKAINAKIPPPPHAKTGLLGSTRRGLVREHEWFNTTNTGSRTAYHDFHVPRAIQGLAFLSIILTACVFLFLSFESSRSRLRRHSYVYDTIAPEPDAIDMMSVSEPTAASTGTLRHSPPFTEISLRKRAIRSHPIYRHATLGEAIHAEDMTEIRARLDNGEDVNEHWPYLIYKLAISSPSDESTKRLEIARLCLDFGADVNALKGWNGQSALMIAIHFSNVDVAKLLIANGAMVCYSPPDSNLTALHSCVRLAATGSATDALSIMQSLFAHGAKANQPDRLGETALHKLLIDAWYFRHEEERIKKLYPIAMCLAEHGADMPATIKEKYIIDNPLWNMLYITIREAEWPEDIRPISWNVRIVRKLNWDKQAR